MSLFLIYFWLFTLLLIAKSIYGAIFLFRVSYYLKTPLTGHIDKHPKFVLFIPLLHETGIVPELVKHFSSLIKQDPTAILVFVTTEREFHDGPTKKIPWNPFSSL